MEPNQVNSMQETEMNPSQTLQEALDRLELEVPPEQLTQLETYCSTLWEWNEKINLTRHTNYDLFARRDLLDSWRLAKQLEQNEEVLDVGTGGGVPGLLLAILRPDLEMSVCDSVEKKIRVVQDIVKRLDLPIAVYSSRVQLVVDDMRYHSLVTRAVGSIAKLLGWLEDHWLSFDRLLAIKGPRWVEERAEARHRGLLANLELRIVDSYPMPGTESESVILQIDRKRSS